MLNQTYPLYRIIIVDNNSNEHEKEVINNIAQQDHKIDVLWLDQNLGGAGGFEAGMKKALNELKSDWFWIMDDDAYPTPECLETLLSYKDEFPNIGSLCPAIYGIDNNAYQMYHHKIVTKYIMEDKRVNENYQDLSEVTKIEANAFVGPLVSTKVVEALGVADSGVFIYGDDTEYTYRVSREFNIYLIKNAIIQHQDPPITNNVGSPKSWWKSYYEIRNRFLFIGKFQHNLFLRTFAQAYLLFKVMKSLVATLIKPNYKGYRKIRLLLLLKACKDGIFNRKGKTIDPVEYIRNIENVIKKPWI